MKLQQSFDKEGYYERTGKIYSGTAAQKISALL